MNEIIKTKIDKENGMEYRVFKNNKGFAVGVYDIEAGETVTIINCKDKNQAEEKFNEASKMCA